MFVQKTVAQIEGEKPRNSWGKSNAYLQVYYHRVTKRKRKGLEPLPMICSDKCIDWLRLNVPNAVG